MAFSGGGERLLLEGLAHFAGAGREAALVADGRPVGLKGNFEGVYDPLVLSAPEDGKLVRALARIPPLGQVFRLYREARLIRGYRPDVVIANSQHAAARLYRMRLLHFLPRFATVCFLHGSPFQFAADPDKYALIFRSRFRAIRDADPVYRDTVPERPIPMLPWRRLAMEAEVLFHYLGVRGTKMVFVLTPMNQREMRLLYRHPDVRVAHGAFPRALLGRQRRVDLRSALGTAGKKALISVCRLEEKKRVDLILRAFAVWVSRVPDAVLLIGGTGAARPSLQALAGELGVADRVRFLGFITDESLHDHYLAADAFVSADIADYDITTLVALALGLKAVVSAQHDFDPGLEGLGQLFHAAPDPEGFAEAFSRALASGPACDPSARARLLDGYTWEAYFGKILSFLDEAK